MSWYDYKAGLEIAKQDWPFYGVVQAAMRQADSDNLEKLKAAFPEVYQELQERIRTPGGLRHTDNESGGGV